MNETAHVLDLAGFVVGVLAVMGIIVLAAHLWSPSRKPRGGVAAPRDSAPSGDAPSRTPAPGTTPPTSTEPSAGAAPSAGSSPATSLSVSTQPETSSVTHARGPLRARPREQRVRAGGRRPREQRLRVGPRRQRSPGAGDAGVEQREAPGDQRGRPHGRLAAGPRTRRGPSPVLGRAPLDRSLRAPGLPLGSDGRRRQRAASTASAALSAW